MKKKLLLLFLLITSISLTGCNGKLSEDKIKKELEVNTKEKTFKVNKVIYATDTITINEIKMNVKNNTITLGDHSLNSIDMINKQITGYYDQSAALYNIYILTENKKGKTIISKLQKKDTESFNNVTWENKNIENATALVLIDCIETIEPMGQTPLRYQVYAIVKNELILID